MEDQQRQANMLGLALAHGVVNLANLREAAACEEPDLLKALVALGVMDAEDLEALKQSLDRRTAGSNNPEDEPTQKHTPSAPAPELLWEIASGPKARTPTPAQTVLTALSMPTWKQYRNLRFIGEGGMGRIFKGYDPTLKRVVALKFLSRDAPDMIQRFILEAQHQGSLDHPNICKVYEVGDWQGQPYIAMQFIQGEMLDSTAGTMSLREKAQVIETVAEAIHAAHRQGLIHRDLKPANIMIRRTEDGRPKPYILDFGLAHSIVSSGLTMQGMVLGTLHYMAPEQARGDVASIGRQTDVYGLGATLYRILSGQPPFARAKGLAAIRLANEDEVEPLRQLAPEVPADLQTIVMKCLEREPARRYPTARELAEDLRRFLDDEPIRARTPTLTYRMEKWSRKHKPLVATAGVSLVALLALGAWGLSTRSHAAAQARWAQHFGQQAERMEAQLRYAHLLPLHDLGGDRQAAVLAMGAMDGDIRKAGNLAAGPAHYAQGRGFLALGEPDRAKLLLEKAWSEGFRTAEVSNAYGQVAGLLYQRELELAQRIEQTELREARIKELQDQLRKPALWHLHAGAAVDSPLFPDALIAFYDGRLDEALAKTRQAFQARPWFYEAKELEGEILLAQARALQDPKRILAALPPAIEAFLAAQRVAPSDAGPYLGEARAWREALEQEYASGSGSPRSLDACRAATRKAAIVTPRSGQALAILAGALGAWGRQCQNRGQDPFPAVDEAYERANEALALEPLNREARSTRATVASLQGHYLAQLNLDPRPKLLQAISDFQRSLELDPMDPQASTGEATAYTWLMSYQTSVGLPPWQSFEAMLSLTLRSIRQHPGLASLYRSLGFIWGERTEYERLSGLDPLPSAAQSVHQFQLALAINAQDFRSHIGLGNAHQMEAQHALALGRDPRPAATLAIQSFERSIALNPKLYVPYRELASIHLLLSQACLDEAGDPGPSMAMASAWLNKGLAINPNFFELYVLGGQLRLLRAKVSVAKGLDPQPELQGAQETFQKALTLVPGEAEALMGLAEGHLLRAQRPAADWRAEIARGEACLAQPLAANPRNANLQLMAGSLGLFKARHTGDAQAFRRAKASLQEALALNRNLARQVAPYLRMVQ